MILKRYTIYFQNIYARYPNIGMINLESKIDYDKMLSGLIDIYGRESIRKYDGTFEVYAIVQINEVK